MVQSREKQLSESQNETKLEQVQLRFPSDDLFLNHTLNIMEVCVWVGENMCMNMCEREGGSVCACMNVCYTVLYSIIASVSHCGNKLVDWIRHYQTYMQPLSCR